MKSNIRKFGITVARWGAVSAACCALTAPAFGQANGDDPNVNVTEYDTVDITVQDTDLAQVLQMLSIQSKKNIITSKSVSATVTANLYNVTFHEALDAILRVNGYRYIEEGNFIYIYTQQEYDEIQAAQRNTESRIFDLEYLSAVDAYESIVPLLSENGQAAFRGDVEQGIKPDLGNVGADSYAYTAKLVVNDYPENLDDIADLLSQLDTPPQQVLVEATILQTTLDESNAFGIDFAALGSINFTDLTDPLSAVNNLLNGNDSTNGFQPGDNEAFGLQGTPGNTVGPGTLKVGVIEDDVAVFLKLLDEVTDNTVLARPKIMALNRQRAEVLVGTRFGYLSTTATDTTTTQTVEFLDTGVQLVFRPFISKNGMIRMELAPSVSEASLRTITDSNGAFVTIPDEITNELTTNVRVRDGETLVLGGLFRESTRITRRQVPLLGDIPIVGNAFRGQDDTVDRNEIIFLITPSVVNDEKLWAIGESTHEYAEDIQVGARKGLLAFSREKQTDGYNQQAFDAFARGDTEKALYYINNSLRLYPMQPEMIRFRERVTGQKMKSHERGLAERVLRRELGPISGAMSNDDSMARGFQPGPGNSTGFASADSQVGPQNSPWSTNVTNAQDNFDSFESASSNSVDSESFDSSTTPSGSFDSTETGSTAMSNFDDEFDQFNSDFDNGFSTNASNTTASTTEVNDSQSDTFETGDFVRSTADGRLEFEVEQMPVGALLKRLGELSGKSVVVSDNVQGAVSAKLYGVSFYDALNAVLHVRNLSYIEQDGEIIVGTDEQLDAITAAEAWTEIGSATETELDSIGFESGAATSATTAPISTPTTTATSTSNTTTAAATPKVKSDFAKNFDADLDAWNFDARTSTASTTETTTVPTTVALNEASLTDVEQHMYLEFLGDFFFAVGMPDLADEMQDTAVLYEQAFADADNRSSENLAEVAEATEERPY